jgi:hypothetical protein
VRGREFISIENVSQRESESHGMRQTQIAPIKTGSDRLITERKKASVLKKAGIAAERMKYMRSTGSSSSVNPNVFDANLRDMETQMMVSAEKVHLSRPLKFRTAYFKELPDNVKVRQIRMCVHGFERCVSHTHTHKHTQTLDGLELESRNAISTFKNEVRLKAAVRGTYNLTDIYLEAPSLHKHLHAGPSPHRVRVCSFVISCFVVRRVFESTSK